MLRKLSISLLIFTLIAFTCCKNSEKKVSENPPQASQSKNGSDASANSLQIGSESGIFAQKDMPDLLKAAQAGVPQAQYELGTRYAQGKGVSEDESQAAEWYKNAAEKGFAPAQCELGFHYAKGLGVKQSDVEAVNWFRKSAEQGYAKAQFNLALMYQNDRTGEGGESILVNRKKLEEMLKWYRKAAEQGYPPAMYNLGSILADSPSGSDRQEGETWLRKYRETK